MSASNIVGGVSGHSNYNTPRYSEKESSAMHKGNQVLESIPTDINRSKSEPIRQLSQIQGMIENMNNSVSHVQKSLHFRVHESSGQLIVEVQDMKTGEVIRSIPPEELLDSLGKIRESIGALLDTEG